MHRSTIWLLHLIPIHIQQKSYNGLVQFWTEFLNDAKTELGFFGPGTRVPKSHSSCSCSCCSRYTFCKNPQGFVNTQRSATKFCVHIHAYIPYRSTASDFQLTYAALSFLWSKFVSCYRFKTWHWTFTKRTATSQRLLQHGARWSVAMNIYAQAVLKVSSSK